MHLSLLKVKAIAESSDLPEELRRGVSKPDLPEEEATALHNVTSSLYNREQVKKVMSHAIKSVCGILEVPVPGNSKRTRKDKLQEQEDQPSNQIPPKDAVSVATTGGQHASEDVYGDETDFEGFTSDCEGVAPQQPADSDDEADEKTQFSKYDDLLASSSDEEDWDDAKFDKFRGKEQADLDDISVSGSDEEGSEQNVGEEGAEEVGSQSDASSGSPSPPPEKKRKKEKKANTEPVSGSTFLPSLMGGYISGSESEASDIEEAKPKKRRGQRARQAIWEQKYGSGAKHLQKQPKGGRDAGWDMKRGAVDPEDQGRNTPWKKGIRTPLSRNNVNHGRENGNTQPAVKVTKKDDEGTLHPSWEARKKEKESQKNVAFSGQKMVFD